MMFMGLEVVESPYAFTKEPARIHKHGHKRIQKKWNKRYGFVQRPAIFFINQRTVMVAPGHSAILKLALESEK